MAILIFMPNGKVKVTEHCLNEGKAFASKLKRYLAHHYRYLGEVYFLTDRGVERLPTEEKLDADGKPIVEAKEIGISKIGHFLNKGAGSGGGGVIVNYLIILGNIDPDRDYTKFVRPSYLARLPIHVLYSNFLSDEQIQSLRETVFSQFFKFCPQKIQMDAISKEDALVEQLAKSFIRDIPREKRLYRGEFECAKPRYTARKSYDLKNAVGMHHSPWRS